MPVDVIISFEISLLLLLDFCVFQIWIKLFVRLDHNVTCTVIEFISSYSLLLFLTLEVIWGPQAIFTTFSGYCTIFNAEVPWSIIHRLITKIDLITHWTISGMLERIRNQFKIIASISRITNFIELGCHYLLMWRRMLIEFIRAISIQKIFGWLLDDVLLTLVWSIAHHGNTSSLTHHLFQSFVLILKLINCAN
jgi:hypothetical protein